MSNFSGRRLVIPYHASWKGIYTFKEKFFLVRPGPNYPRLFHDESGDPLFPLYWTENPRSKIRLRTLPKSDVDDQLISLLRQATPVPASKVLGSEHHREKLISLLSNYSSPTPLILFFSFNICTRLVCVSTSIVIVIMLTLFFCRISRDGTTHQGRASCC
jgi:hypothetical protein